APTTVLHVLDHAPPILSGYSVRVHNTLCTLRAHGWPVLAAAPAPRAGQLEEDIDGVRYLRLPRRTARSGALRSMLQLYWDLRHQLRTRRIALVHAHTPVRTGLPALWAARGAGVPIIYELHGLWEESGIARGRLTRRSLRYHAGRRLET